MKLSIVSTLYQSADYITEFHSRISKSAIDLVGDDYEIILVNDGSPDESLKMAIGLTEQDAKVSIIDLSRNYGHHKAMMTGLFHAQGEKIFLIDIDLEEKPEWLLEFDNAFEDDVDVVFGVQEKRKGKYFEQISGKWFYKVFDYLSGINLPRNIVTTRLMSKRYVESLIQHLDQEIFMAGLWHITGFKQVELIVQKESTSDTSYTLSKKISILVNSITSFSNTPLKIIFYIGLSISVIAIFYIVSIVFNKIFIAKPLDGWTSIMASIWLLGGMIISFIGVIGIYLSKIFSETKRRPYTIVRHVYGKKR